MKALEEYKKRTQSVKSFKKSLERMRKVRKECRAYHDIDKHSDGFSTDPNTWGIKVKALYFRSFTGYFGNSDCYSDFDKSEFAEDCLLEAMNVLKDEILDKTLEIMQQRTEKIKEEAMKEYAFMVDEFNSDEQ